MIALSDLKETCWYKERPDIIKELINKFPPSSSVLIKDTSQKAYTYSWSEDGTISLVIDPSENKHLSNALSETYKVFRYKPDDLEFICENPEMSLEDESAEVDVKVPEGLTFINNFGGKE